MPLCASCEKEVDSGAKFCPLCGANITVVAGAGEDPYIGKLVAGKYAVESLLGEGGMGKVYKAIQQPLDKAVVLKVLRQQLHGDASLVARFQREARAASRLSHPNSISVTDFGQMEDGSLYICMEYLDGKDLGQVLAADGPLPAERIGHIMGQVLSALADAHAANIIHRDLKPENIMIVPRRDDPDYVKVLDFGIAKIQDPVDSPDAVALTQAGLVCGTPEYMSPEQARGERLDARSDLYAIGIILYQLATGKLPFTADTSVGIVTKHLVEQPAPPRTVYASVSPKLEQLILKCMSKDKDHRPSTAEQLKEELLAVVRSGDAVAAGPAPAVSARSGTAVFGAASAAAVSAPAAPAASAPAEAVPPPAPAPVPAVSQTSDELPGAGQNKLFVVLGIVVVLAAGAGGFFFASGGGESAPPNRVAKKADPPPVKDTGPVGTAEAPPVKEPPPKRVTTEKRLPKKSPPKRPSRDLKTARRFTSQGDGSWARGDFEKAIYFYKKAQVADPTDAQLDRKIGFAYLSTGENRPARKHLQAYLRKAPNARDRAKVQALLAETGG